MDHYDTWNDRLAGPQRENGITQKLQTEFLQQALGYRWRIFASIWCDLESLAAKGTQLIVN